MFGDFTSDLVLGSYSGFWEHLNGISAKLAFWKAPGQDYWESTLFSWHLFGSATVTVQCRT